MVEFKKQLIETDFAPIKPGKHSLFGGGRIPNNTDVFYKAKWHELFERYESARLMLIHADSLEDVGWINNIKEKRQMNYMKMRMKTYFYEASLIFYNILIDLSWIISYVAMEYVVYYKNEKGVQSSIDLNDSMIIEKAYDCLRKMESNVLNPDMEENPLNYFKKTHTAFNSVILRIETFWKSFSSGTIRSKYNYIKHRGKPLFDEIFEMTKPPFIMSIKIGEVEVPSSIDQVQEKWNLNNCVEELTAFDNNVLFDYLCGLVYDINEILQPSSMVY